MLRAIVFDFDGVLVDTEPLHYEAFRRIAPGIGVELDYAEYLRTYIGFDDRDAVRALHAAAGRPEPTDADLARWKQSKQAAFDELIASGVPMIAGARALLEEAAQRMPVAIASGATRRDIDLILGPLGLRERFRLIVSADDVEQSKPHPQTYALAVEKLAAHVEGQALRPHQCLAIEDTAAGLASARAAGLRTLGLTTTSSADALADAERIIGDLDGVSLDQLQGWYG